MPAAADREELVALLDEGGYARYDERTARGFWRSRM